MPISHAIQQQLSTQSWIVEKVQSASLDQLSYPHFKPNLQKKIGRQDVVYLGVFLICLIILDLLLTSEGVSSLGIEAEGNNLLRSLMFQFGPDEALLYVKGTSLILATILITFAKGDHLIQRMIGLICLLHVFVAVLPWIYLLYFQ